MQLKVLLALLALLVALPPENVQAARRRSKIRASKGKISLIQPSLSAGYEALSKNDVDGAIKAWRPFFKAAPGAVSTRALWPQFARLCLETNRLDDMENAARDADSPDAMPELRAAAHFVLRRAAWREKRVKEAQSLGEKLDFISDWQVIGPFENAGETAFNNALPPEREETFGKTIKSIENRPLKWRALPASHEGTALVGRFLGNDEPGVFYAATAINVPASRTVQLRFNHSGAAKIWVNGQLVLTDAKMRQAQNLDPDVFVITQKLEAGWNSLLVKIADTGLSETFFSLRVTSDNGADLSALQTDASRFRWQPLIGQREQAVPDLFKRYGTPHTEQEARILLFAQQFFSESAEALPAISLLSPEQVALQQKAIRLASEGKLKEATTTYNSLLRRDEFLPDALRKKARLQKQQSDVEGALETLRKLRTFRPQDAEILAEYAELLREQGNRSGALTVYGQAITLDPSQVFWREQARVLSGEKSLFDIVPDLKNTVANPPVGVANPPAKAEATLLLDEARQIVYDDRATLTRFHQIIQINSVNAALRYANFSLDKPSLRARLTLENAQVISRGKRRALSGGNNQNTLKIPALQVGDIIDITYRIEDKQSGSLERQFWTQWFFNLAGMPVQTSRFVLITPPQVIFNIRSHGDVPAPARTQVKNGNALWDVREWRLENLPARPLEPLSPAPQDANLWIDISSVVTWKSIAAWYHASLAPLCLPDSDVRAKALELTKNARGEEEKLRALHGYVARGLREEKSAFSIALQVPQPGSKIIRAGYGKTADKAALLVALARATGIEARLAAFNKRREGVTPFLPSPRFRHLMVVAKIQEADVWLDAANADFDNLPAENQGVPALLLEEDTISLLTTPVLAAENNIATTTCKAQLDEDGQLRGEVETSFSGEWNTTLRAGWQALPSVRRAEYVSDVTRLFMPALRSSKEIVHNFALPDQPLKMQFTFNGARYAALEESTLTFQLPWQELAGLDKAVLNNETPRTQECEMAALRGLGLDTLKLQLPVGFAPQELPGEIKDTSPFGHYRFSYKTEGETDKGVTLIVTREVLLTPLRVARDDVPAYVAFCKAIAQESGRRIILKK